MNLEELAVMTPKKFAIKIEEIVKEGLGQTTYMDAILDYCERNQMEVGCYRSSHLKTPQGKNRSRRKGIELSSKSSNTTQSKE